LDTNRTRSTAYARGRTEGFVEEEGGLGRELLEGCEREEVWEGNRGQGGVVIVESGDASPVLGVAVELFPGIWMDDVSAIGKGRCHTRQSHDGTVVLPMA
jgi:hypothetical protein